MATLYANYSSGGGAIASCHDVIWFTQTFTASVTHSLTSIQLQGKKTGTGTIGTMTFYVKAVDANHKPTGAALSTGTYDGDTLTTSAAWIDITMSATTITAGTEYAIVLSAPSTTGSMTFDPTQSGTGTYADGVCFDSDDSGANWYANSGDIWFKEYGNPTVGKTGQIAVVETRFHYIDAYGQERYLEGTPV